MTNEEKYNHLDMTDDELETRIAADMYELAERLKKGEWTNPIGILIHSLMRKFREAYRTAKLLKDLK